MRMLLHASSEWSSIVLKNGMEGFSTVSIAASMALSEESDASFTSRILARRTPDAYARMLEMRRCKSEG